MVDEHHRKASPHNPYSLFFCVSACSLVSLFLFSRVAGAIWMQNVTPMQLPGSFPFYFFCGCGGQEQRQGMEEENGCGATTLPSTPKNTPLRLSVKSLDPSPRCFLVVFYSQETSNSTKTKKTLRRQKQQLSILGYLYQTHRERERGGCGGEEGGRSQRRKFNESATALSPLHQGREENA
jgi:hypothetical protein